MSFKAKRDFYGVAGEECLCVSSTLGKSASLAEVQGQTGEIVCQHVYGVTYAPSCEYEVRSECSHLSGVVGAMFPDAGCEEGVVVDLVADKLTISTAAGSAPKISVSGRAVGVGEGAPADLSAALAVPGFSLSARHHAQILFDAFTLSGAGCHLTAASYTISCIVSTATKDGAVVSYDVNAGKIEASVTIRQCGETTPMLEADGGWVISSPLTESNPDSDFPTWTATLVKAVPLEK